MRPWLRVPIPSNTLTHNSQGQHQLLRCGSPPTERISCPNHPQLVRQIADACFRRAGIKPKPVRPSCASHPRDEERMLQYTTQLYRPCRGKARSTLDVHIFLDRPSPNQLQSVSSEKNEVLVLRPRPRKLPHTPALQHVQTSVPPPIMGNTSPRYPAHLTTDAGTGTTSSRKASILPHGYVYNKQDTYSTSRRRGAGSPRRASFRQGGRYTPTLTAPPTCTAYQPQQQLRIISVPIAVLLLLLLLLLSNGTQGRTISQGLLNFPTQPNSSSTILASPRVAYLSMSNLSKNTVGA